MPNVFLWKIFDHFFGDFFAVLHRGQVRVVIRKLYVLVVLLKIFTVKITERVHGQGQDLSGEKSPHHPIEVKPHLEAQKPDQACCQCQDEGLNLKTHAKHLTPQEKFSENSHKVQNDYTWDRQAREQLTIMHQQVIFGIDPFHPIEEPQTKDPEQDRHPKSQLQLFLQILILADMVPHPKQPRNDYIEADIESPHEA
jgi:hypothetical protein